MNISMWGSVAALLLAANTALAQDSGPGFDGLADRIATGDSVRITFKGGETAAGKLESMDGGLLRLKGREEPLARNSIERLEKKRKDPLWNGLLIGAGAGAAGGLLVAASMCHNDSECSAIAGVIFVPTGIGIGLATGAVVDSGITKYDTVFENSDRPFGSRFRIAPVIAREQKGVAVSFTF